MGGDGLHPAFVKQGNSKVVVCAFRQKLAAQGDDFRQVEVVPGGDLGTAEALIARVQPGAELDDNGIGVGSDEFLRLVVKDSRATAAADLRHDDVFEFAEVVVDLRQHARRFGVGEQALVALLFDGFCPERDEQGFGEDGHVRGDFCGHLSLASCCKGFALYAL